MGDYCVYFHINPLKNEVFYVGKGVSYRPFSKHGRSIAWWNTVKKYGKIVDVVHEGISEEEAIQWEKFYITRIGRRDLGKGPLVNFTDGGDGTSGHKHNTETLAKLRAHKFSTEHKAKISAAGRGRKHTSATLAKISAAGRGREFSVEHKAKLSTAKLKCTAETRAKLSVAGRGRKHTSESRAKMSAARRGRKFSAEHKEKLAAANRGRECSPETRAKISAKLLLRPKKYHTEEERRSAKRDASRRARLNATKVI